MLTTPQAGSHGPDDQSVWVRSPRQEAWLSLSTGPPTLSQAPPALGFLEPAELRQRAIARTSAPVGPSELSPGRSRSRRRRSGRGRGAVSHRDARVVREQRRDLGLVGNDHLLGHCVLKEDRTCQILNPRNEKLGKPSEPRARPSNRPRN